MADLQILTENALGDGWIDNTPGAVSTGYQAQNTNITARSLGLDSTHVVNNGDSTITVKGNSGAIDVNGVPFVITNDKIFQITAFADRQTSFFIIRDTIDPLLKDLLVTTAAISWNSTKNYYETSAGERALNWTVTRVDNSLTISRIDNSTDDSGNPDNYAGIRKAGRVKLGTPGAYYIPVSSTGVYELFAISGGLNDYLGPNENHGGSCARVVLKLEVGQLILCNVGGYDNSSTISVSGRLSLEATPSPGGSSISVTGDYKESDSWDGGRGARSQSGLYLAGGGGAAPFSEGGNASSYEVLDLDIVINGQTRLGDFGSGLSGKGYIEINWMSE